MLTRLTMLAVVFGFAASPALAQDLNTDQIVKYYRKKNNVPPTAQISVSNVKDSPIKGAKEGVLEVAGPQTRRVPFTASPRSEEHTSELQSLRHLVCRLL